MPFRGRGTVRVSVPVPGVAVPPADLPGSFATLLAGAIDYAGLFPPASRPMAEAVRTFDRERAGREAWALGRFVVPATRLEELVGVASPLWQRDTTARPWLLSALVGDAPARDAARIAEHNDRHAKRAVVDTIEGRGADAVAIRRLAALAPAGVRTFVEFPHDADFAVLARAAHDSRVGAKLRTGGLVPGAFPSAGTVARFLAACRHAGIPCKATAGLHHALRGSYALTYAPDSPQGMMFGFVNVLCAAALAWSNAPLAQLEDVLEESEPGAFRAGDDGVRWRGTFIATETIAAARGTFLSGFGSCSFREPVTEGEALMGRGA